MNELEELENLKQALSQESWDAHRVQGKAADARDVAWERVMEIEALAAFNSAKAAAERAFSTLKAFEAGENAANTYKYEDK